MNDLAALAEAEHSDAEMVPEILPVDSRLALTAKVDTLLPLFERAAAIIPGQEIIKGTALALLEVLPGGDGSLPYVRVSATNGDLTSALVADGITVHMTGAARVPARKMVDILKLAPTDTVRIEVLGNTVHLRAGRALWTVQTEPGSHLPPAPDVATIPTHTLRVGDFLRALVVTTAAVSRTLARNSLMQVQVRGGALTGADGGRLHRQYVADLPATLSTTLPLAVAGEVIRLLKGTDEEHFEFGSNASHLVFVVGQDRLIAQRLFVDYPDIEAQVLGPALTNLYTLSVDRENLLSAIKRVRVNADPDYRAVFLSLVPGAAAADGLTWSLTVSATDRSGNEARETLPVAWVGDKAARSLCVNHRSLSDLLSVLDTEVVALKIGEDVKSSRPPLFVDRDVNGFTGWVSQIRPGYLS